MLFNSHIFIFLFLPLTFVVFRLFGRFGGVRAGAAVLIVASLVFYGYWNPPYLALLVGSIVANYFIGRWIIGAPERKRTWITVLGVALDLALIGYFKYAGFLVSGVDALIGANWTVGRIVLPLGISFFTFQQIAYLVDCRRGEVSTGGFGEYALFVCFFPQLIAGPIVHHREVLVQFRKPAFVETSYRNIAAGCTYFAFGLFKKVVIADSLSPYVGRVFDGAMPPVAEDAWLGTLAYTLQIYFDFSGYSDMAIGLGRLFNVTLPANFDSPYKSLSIIDFWKRWHITLSAFLKDYLYIPLGGNQKGPVRRYVNLMITMLLGGLWHGASWTFVLWGALHGAYLCINHGWRAAERRFPRLRIPKLLAGTTTFAAVATAWVFFRATTFTKAMEILRGMAGLNGVSDAEWITLNAATETWGVTVEKRFILVALFLLAAFTMPSTREWIEERGVVRSYRGAAVVGAVFTVSIVFMTRVSEFLYFQF